MHPTGSPGWSRAAFDDDEAVQPALSACSRSLGESANSLPDETRHALTGIEWEDIRRLRIVLAHHYHRVDPDQVWTTATKDVAHAAELIRAQPPGPRTTDPSGRGRSTLPGQPLTNPFGYNCHANTGDALPPLR